VLNGVFNLWCNERKGVPAIINDNSQLSVTVSTAEVREYQTHQLLGVELRHGDKDLFDLKKDSQKMHSVYADVVKKLNVEIEPLRWQYGENNPYTEQQPAKTKKISRD
jgi:hypothetical protein